MRRTQGRLFAAVAVGLLLSRLAWALIARQENSKTLASNAAKNGVFQVKVASAKSGSYEAKLTLPGTLQGIFETQIYARTTGFVNEWHKDIGQSVKKGDLLATLDIPEVNKQVEKAKVNFDLAKAPYERWAKLRE